MLPARMTITFSGVRGVVVGVGVETESRVGTRVNGIHAFTP